MGMKSLDRIIADIDSQQSEIIDTTMSMIRIPALAPVNGGDGESKKADYLMTKTEGFDEVRRFDVPDRSDPTVMRSNIVAIKRGKGKGTLWFVAHIDVVPTGDPELWDTPPFDPVLKDGRIYGRGTEDDGQSVISTMYAARQFLGEELDGMSLGVAWVADEETTSVCGIQYLLDQGVFSEDDVIVVPDYCTPDGGRVDVAEKHIMWLKFSIEGKTTHASTPHKGINAYKVSTLLLMDLIESFDSRFDDTDPMYLPKNSTFEPTKRPATVENINTIPGHDEFCMDIRLNPEYDPELVMKLARETAEVYERSTGARITVEAVQMGIAGRPSSVDSNGYRALSDSIEEVMGRKPEPVGIAGGTCANFFRQKGLDAYAWQTGDNSLHAPNEYLVVDNLMNDTKVFATLIHKLCSQ
ncbi:peptidase ArgE/DapE family [methanogenic archaeon mixed culture ISO4-G1]|nr:peptidase ArgE/DapE family [methanogenic archaeon mixed culture ISO4-G1]